jgi:hypothetical protein
MQQVHHFEYSQCFSFPQIVAFHWKILFEFGVIFTELKMILANLGVCYFSDLIFATGKSLGTKVS